MIKVSGLKKAFKTNQVLSDVNFMVKKSSIFALLGSNGAGKTTIVKILATLLQPDSGQLTINGFDVVKQSEDVRRFISLTGQLVAVDEVLTGRENLTLIGELNSLKEVKNKVDEWLAFFKLTDAANQRVSTYSGGMRRRLDIAMSLLGNPKVLFLDEPTTGLDPQNRIAMWDLIKRLAAEGTTIFLTTQYIEEAEYLANHIAILHEGKIIIDGPVQNIKSLMPESGGQLNFQSMDNALEAIQILNDSGIRVEGIEEKLPSLEEVFLMLINEKKELDHHG